MVCLYWQRVKLTMCIIFWAQSHTYILNNYFGQHIQYLHSLHLYCKYASLSIHAVVLQTCKEKKFAKQNFVEVQFCFRLKESHVFHITFVFILKNHRCFNFVLAPHSAVKKHMAETKVFHF